MAAEQRSRERGQVIPLVVVLIVAIGGLAVLLGRMGADAVDRSQAQTVADLSALAGAAQGRDEAVRIAKANGAKVISWEAEGADVRVRVLRHGFEASARARRGRVATESLGNSTLRVGDHHG